MDKEKLITVAIGLAVGTLIAGAYFVVVKFLPSFNAPKLTYTPAVEQETASPSAKETLTVLSPLDETSVKESPITVSGKSQPGTKIIVFANADEKIASADGQGNFSAIIKLDEGENDISITSLSDTGISQTINRNVILEIKL